MTPLFEIKSFKGLSVTELYQILKLRSEVFIIEQNCIYQDIDDKDEKALHLLGVYNNKIVAYCRLFNAGDYFKNASIGRVVINKEYRDKKWGHLLMQNAMKGIFCNYGEQEITISAQLYLKGFYESHGFEQISETYLEDGIPHIEMLRK